MLPQPGQFPGKPLPAVLPVRVEDHHHGSHLGRPVPLLVDVDLVLGQTAEGLPQIDAVPQGDAEGLHHPVGLGQPGQGLAPAHFSEFFDDQVLRRMGADALPARGPHLGPLARVALPGQGLFGEGHQPPPGPAQRFEEADFFLPPPQVGGAQGDGLPGRLGPDPGVVHCNLIKTMGVFVPAHALGREHQLVEVGAQLSLEQGPVASESPHDPVLPGLYLLAGGLVEIPGRLPEEAFLDEQPVKGEVLPVRSPLFGRGSPLALVFFMR